MALGQHKRAVGVFSNYRDTELALMELQSTGFPMNKVSVIGEDLDGSKVGGASTGKSTDEQVGGGAKAGATAGAVTGGLIGLLGSIGALAIPGVGPVMAGGALATLLADTAVGGAIGAAAGGLVGGLVGLGVPEDKAKVYSDRISAGEYLVVVEGTDSDIATAEGIFSVRNVRDWAIYDVPPDTGSSRPASGRHKRAVGVFSTRRETEQALGELRAAGFNMERVSVIAKDADSKGEIAGVDVKESADNKADEGATKGALTGGALGGLTGLLVGLGLLAIPGIGPIMLAGAEATAIATTLAGTALGATAGGLIGALVGLGIPEKEAKAYGDRVARGDYLVLLNGSESEIAEAQRILSRGGIQDWGVYDYPASGTVRTERSLDDDAYSPNQGVTGRRF